jgi:hypothetical protein
VLVVLVVVAATELLVVLASVVLVVDCGTEVVVIARDVLVVAPPPSVVEDVELVVLGAVVVLVVVPARVVLVVLPAVVVLVVLPAAVVLVVLATVVELVVLPATVVLVVATEVEVVCGLVLVVVLGGTVDVVGPWLRRFFTSLSSGTEIPRRVSRKAPLIECFPVSELSAWSKPMRSRIADLSRLLCVRPEASRARVVWSFRRFARRSSRSQNDGRTQSAWPCACVIAAISSSSRHRMTSKAPPAELEHVPGPVGVVAGVVLLVPVSRPACLARATPAAARTIRTASPPSPLRLPRWFDMAPLLSRSFDDASIGAYTGAERRANHVDVVGRW